MDNLLAKYIVNPLIYEYYQEVVNSVAYSIETHKLNILKKDNYHISYNDFAFNIQRICIHLIIHRMIEDDLIEFMFGVFKEYIMATLAEVDHLIYRDYLANSFIHTDIFYTKSKESRRDKYLKLQSLVDQCLTEKPYQEHGVVNIFDLQNKMNIKARDLLISC